MDTIHALAADVVVVLVVVGTGWSLFDFVARRDSGPRFTAFAAAVVSATIVAAAAGGLLFLTGSRPADGLHFLYAALAVAVVPLARSYFAGGGRRDRIVMLAAFGLLAALVYRLFTTG